MFSGAVFGEPMNRVGSMSYAARLHKNAKELRKNQTRAEALLWNRLRAKQVQGVKFRRQQPIGSYIVDFVSLETGIIIELDGGQHAADREGDRVRDECLRQQGFTILRFWNNEIFENIEGVMEIIRRHCLRQESPSPGPSHRGRGIW